MTFSLASARSVLVTWYRQVGATSMTMRMNVRQQFNRRLWPAFFLPVVFGISVASAQPAPLNEVNMSVHVESGAVSAERFGPIAMSRPTVIFADVVRVSDAPWLRLHFDEVILAGSARDGDGSFLRLTSLHDGGQQIMDTNALKQWQSSSAYFNGNAVLVELVASTPGENRVSILQVTTGVAADQKPISICDGEDERELSNDPRDARLLPIGCTGFLFNDQHYCVLTAGHCAGNLNAIEFNVPLQGPNGEWVFADPDDQYPVDPESMQIQNNPCANDWAYFGVFPNSNTGLTPLQAQSDSYVLDDAAPPVAGQQIRIRGYGTTSFPVPPEWNRAQKEHAGPYNSLSGTSITYRVDTTGGNSGSAVFNLDTGTVIGIHTCGGCTSFGGANHGMAIHQTGLQNALANPQGVCAWSPPTLLGDLNGDGVVDVFDLLILVSEWGACDDTDACPADLNNDGVVDVVDLLLLIDNWGQQ